jgi:RNA polymerase sigma-70 factor (ECF subfamily)
MNSSAAPNDIRRDLVALLPRLRRFALTLTGEPSTADRLIEDVCGRAIQKSHHWKGTGRLESWVFSLIRTTWSDDAKKRARQEPAGKPVASDAHGTPALRKILCLPHGMASAILLADVEQFEYSEAASILGLSEDVFAARLCAARLQLSSLPPEIMERRA